MLYSGTTMYREVFVKLLKHEQPFKLPQQTQTLHTYTCKQMSKPIAHLLQNQVVPPKETENGCSYE